MSDKYTYRFRVKNLDPSAKSVEHKEIEVTASSHAEACDQVDKAIAVTYWHPDAFLGSDDPKAPKPKGE